MATTIRYFGIRHHGPGSARELLRALDELRPAHVLIEGPSDASDALAALNHPAMKTPVALLSYQNGAPERAGFWPMAAFSPEYQAARWALRNQATAEFIDLPAAALQATHEEEQSADAEPAQHSGEDLAQAARRDPIGLLAKVAGYEDGESWWANLIEENPAPGPVFDAICDAMTALRESSKQPISNREAQREAHMRLQIAKARKGASGPIAVVCGAWHVPALKAEHSAKADRALLKGISKTKYRATWVPWTLERLSWQSGYGAGVVAPGWCRHLWEQDNQSVALRWLGKIARELRRHDYLTSTASLIEAHRLAHSLACLRDKSRPGFEEFREATIACLCFGDPTRWAIIQKHLLIGVAVGEIPDNLDQAPLLEDLNRQQKSLRMKPSAQAKTISLDLRSAAGLNKSTLLHRLNLLGVPWGERTDAGNSRGTFRERWLLKWEPEFAVELVENTIYGQSIENAAQARLIQNAMDSDDLAFLAATVRDAMLAQLPESVNLGIDRLSRCAATSGDGLAMIQALPPLAELLRYGQARSFNPKQMQSLFEQIAVQASIALGQAAHSLDESASAEFSESLHQADAALSLVDTEKDILVRWQAALQDLVDRADKDPRVTGVAAQCLYLDGKMSANQAAKWLGHALSLANPVPQAAASFQGFFQGIAVRLVYDRELRGAVHQWLAGLDEDAFVQTLPLFRRVFSSLDRSERKHLFARLFQGEPLIESVPIPDHLAKSWEDHHAHLVTILSAAPQGVQHGN